MRLKNVSASYKNEAIYEDLNIDLNRVGITFIKGDSGTGKSTFLNLLYGIKSFEGEYEIPEKITKFRRNHMAYIFQDFKVQPNLTVMENIVLHMNAKNIEVDYQLIDELLEMCNMTLNKNKVAKVLSGGEKQRLAIVRALVSKPSVLLADEPTGNLDEDTSFEIFDLLKEISMTKAVIVASHSEVLIENYADYVYKIEDKKLVSLKTSQTKNLVLDDHKYGKMTAKNIFKLAFKNFKRNFFKVNAIFITFSLLAALFLALNFSKSNLTTSLEDKYESFNGRKTYLVDLFGYESLKEMDEFIEEYGFDNYIIDTINNRNYTRGIYRMTGMPYEAPVNHIAPLIIFNENFEARKYYPEEYWGQTVDFENMEMKEFPFIHFYDSAPTIFAVNDFDFMKKNLLYGQMPANKFEIVINENTMISFFREFNKKMKLVDENFVEYDVESMSEEEIMKVINDNKLSITYQNSQYYRIDDLSNYTYPIVGVVDDHSFRYDNYSHNKGIEAESMKRKNDRNIYVSTDYLMNQLKLLTVGFQGNGRDYGNQRDGSYIFANAEDVLNIEIDLYEREMFQAILVYDEFIPTTEYLDRIDLISKSDNVDELKYPQYFYELSEDYNSMQSISGYIDTFSVYILSFGLLTALIAYLRYTLKRKKEYLIYELLGMEELEKRKLYYFELLLYIATVLVQITILYFVFTVFLTGDIENIIAVVIYKSRSFELTYTFAIYPVLTVVSLLIPFALYYGIYRRKLIR